MEALRSLEAHRKGGLGVNRIAEMTGREKSQVSRALAGMKEEGLVDRDPTTLAYRCGWRLYALAASTLEARLTQSAAPFLQRLASELHETVYLCVLRDRNVVIASAVSARRGRSRGLWEGDTLPVIKTSSGRALVAEWDKGSIESLFCGGEAVHSIPFESFMSDVQYVRERGYSILHGEPSERFIGVSSPIKDYRNGIIACVMVVTENSTVSERVGAVARLTLRCATQISRSLGYAAVGRGRYGDASV
ncbi:IclR family transcriptional regulator [Streptomyces erythrochromogenes]|uniref:IclR family transcriptional regulator n=1 Tax=Streptomyces erythrochromogenes TaxID=285574 RepID=UPI00369E51BB